MRAGAVGAVEGETARFEFGNIDAAIRAGHGGGVQLLLNTQAAVGAGRGSGHGHQHQTAGHLQGFGDGSFQTLFYAGLNDDAIDDSFDGVVLTFLEGNVFGQVANLSIDAGAKSLLIEFLEFIAKFTFASANDGSVDGDAFAGGQFHDAADNLVRGLARDGPAAVWTMRHADGGVQEAKIVVDFCNGADGGAGAAAGGFLLDGDGGAEAFDGVDIRPLHLVKKLARIGGKGLNIASLALRIDGVEGERGLAGARQAGHHGEGIARDLDRDVL